MFYLKLKLDRETLYFTSLANKIMQKKKKLKINSFGKYDINSKIIWQVIVLIVLFYFLFIFSVVI